ncbi:PAS domain S-box protein [Salipaludibacillus sp. CF4.18]|uniref:PAS domain S-box protein n=1 Tax=Salipaludibacillus sp. CF4.18 TaxID=3373081 RepID=UPI003EE4577C
MNKKVDRSILFEQVFQFSSMGIALISNEGYFLLTNPMLTEMLGYSEKELKEKTFKDLTYVEDLRNSIDRFHQLINGKVSYYQVEKRYVHKNGMFVHCLLNVSAVRDGAGNPLYFISQFQDISDQKLYEQQLKESQEQLTEILETMPNGVLMFDLQGNISYANKMAEEILEINRAEIVSRKMDTPEWKLRTVEGEAIPREELPFSIVMKTKEPVKDSSMQSNQGRVLEKYYR